MKYQVTTQSNDVVVMANEMTIHTVKIGNHTSWWDTKNDPKGFLKAVCPRGMEGQKWWYSEYDQKGNLIEQGQNIGKHAA